MVWGSIASVFTAPIRSTPTDSAVDSLVSGPLSSTSAFLAKVATSPKNDTPNYSHLICVYMPDVLDQTSVTEVSFWLSIYSRYLRAAHACPARS